MVHSLIQRALAERRLSQIDCMLAEQIQPQGGLLGVFMAKAFRQGHCAVLFDEEMIDPFLASVFIDDQQRCADLDFLQQMRRSLEREWKAHAFASHQVVSIDDRYAAFPAVDAMEQRLAEEIVRLARAQPSLSLPPSLHHRLAQLSLSDEQYTAVVGMSRASLSCIAGGPGTGKTYLVGQFLAALCASFDQPLRIGLFAPTGRAVQTLVQSLERACFFEQDDIIESQTIHKAVRSSQEWLSYHCMIIDESSMIDSQLLLQFFQKIPSGTRVIMVGDPDQLPPIDPGKPFCDLLQSSKYLTSLYTAFLTTCHRTSSQDLQSFARAVRSRDLAALSSWTSSEEIRFIPYMPHEFSTFIREVTSMAVQSCDDLSRQIVLSPIRKGIFGTESLNHLLSEPSTQMEPIVISQNRYDFDVMNGDLGLLDKKGGLLCFQHQSIPSVLCPSFERAYALTVHKSQGSEFDHVVFVLPHRAIFDFRLLYTAVTRARKRLTIFGNSSGLVQAVSSREERVTRLVEKIQKLHVL